MGLACLVWLVLMVLFLRKWLFARDEAFAEASDATLCCFVALVA